MSESNICKILEVDQWSASHFKGKTFAEVEEANKNRSGDAASVAALGINRCRIREVSIHAEPSIGTVWLKEDENGKLATWKFRYDSSD